MDESQGWIEGVGMLGIDDENQENGLGKLE